MGTEDIGYVGPTGRERPGEHWNARILREAAEALAITRGAEETAHLVADEMHGLEPDSTAVAELGLAVREQRRQ